MSVVKRLEGLENVHLEGCEGDVCTCEEILSRKMMRESGLTLRQFLKVRELADRERKSR